MSVHMIRVLCEPPRGEAENAISNWVTNYTEWTNDPVEHSLSVTNTKLDGSGTEYVRGDWRFIQDGEDPTSMLNDLSGRLASINGGLWHLLGYHVCEHDTDRPGECTWDERVEDGSIPQGVRL